MLIAERLFIILPPGYLPSKERLKPILESSTKGVAAGLVGELFLRIICQTIITPIDDNISTEEEKMIAYGSFHSLSNYLIGKGISGVIYPSTRTRLRGYHTQNVVAFDVDDFTVIGTSIRTIVAK